jgi:ubiquinone/menaquinone biosynthesis C-methylase UbiE
VNNSRQFYTRLAAAFVRGRAAADAAIGLPTLLLTPGLDDLPEENLTQIIEHAIGVGLRIHKFKRTIPLRRVQRVLGILRGLTPANLLDVGSGRGTFLWPLLEALPEVPITSIDRHPQRVADIAAVRAGGVRTLTTAVADATRLGFAESAFDGVTFLEVLEHIPDPNAALREAVRVARRFVILSVPSKPDDNPEHIHLFDQPMLARMLAEAGARRANFDYVLNHLIAVARVEK